MDISTGLTVAASLFASKEMLLKLLGPTADYLGECGRDWVQKGHENLGNVLRVTVEKLGSKIDKPGQVNLRVFKSVFDEGRFVEDAFSAEYFGGITAAARTVDGKDDSALPWMALVKSLSSLQIRLHFTIYSLFAGLPTDRKESNDPAPISDLELRTSPDEMLDALELTGSDRVAKFVWAAQGLIDSGLISADSTWRIEGVQRASRARRATENIVIRATERGGVLFLRALGLNGLHPEIIPTMNVDYSLTDQIKALRKLPQGAKCVYRPLKDPLINLSQEVEHKLTSLESDIEDVKSSVDECESQIEELQGAIDEQQAASE